MVRSRFLRFIWAVLILIMCSRISVMAASYDKETHDEDYRGRVEQKIVKKNPDFHVEADYGLNGYAVRECGSEVRLYITCDKDFSGKVSVRAYFSENYGEQNMKHSRNVDLSAGMPEYCSFFVNDMGNGIIIVDIIDESGRVVYSEKDTFSMAGDDNTATVAVISDDCAGFSYIDDVVVEQKSGRAEYDMLSVTAENIPVSCVGLDAVNYMIIDESEADFISDDRLGAVMEWLYGGGCLIFTSEEKKLENIVSDNWTVHSGIWDGYNVYSVNAGDGRVVAVPFELSDKSLGGRGKASQIAGIIFNIGYTERINSKLNGYYYLDEDSYGFDTAINQNTKETPSPAGILTVLIVYIVLSGPVTYIILKKKKKREYIWIAIPVWALAGTLVIYLVSLKYQVERPLNLSFVAADISGDVKYEKAYTYILGAKADDYEIGINEDYSNIEAGDNYNYYTYGYDDGMLIEKNITDEEVKLSYSSNRPFQSVDVKTSRISSNDIGYIDDEMTLYTDGIDGNITNDTGYFIKDLVVMTEGYFFCIDEMAPGETVNIDKADNYKLRAGGAYYCMDSYYQEEYGDRTDKDASAVKYRNYYMVQCMSSYDVNPKDGGLVAVWGTIERTPDIISGSDTDDFNCYLVYMFDRHKYADVGGVYYNNIYDLDTMSDLQTEYDPDDLMMYSEEVDINVRFGSSDNIYELGYDDSAYDGGKSNVVVKALNYETGEYEQIFTSGKNKLNGKELSKYMKDGSMSFKFVAPQQGDYYEDAFLPRISAAGGPD